MTRRLHVTNGDSTGNTLAETSLGGEVLAWRDTLHEGPVPAGSRAGLLRARASFLAGSGWGDADALLAALESRDGRLLEALRDGAHVVLWFEHDLYDQLQLLDVLTLARETGGDVELIVVGSFPGRARFTGLGELTAHQLESLWPARTPATREQLDAARAAWDAFRAPEPTRLAALAEERSPQLPFLAPALRRLLEELPARRDGLSGTERRALTAIADGASTREEAFLASQRLEEAPFLGDTWFHRTLAALDGLTTAQPPLRLTEKGERVLAGEEDRVELLGVDRWIGGTHVTPENLWRRDEDTRALSGP